MPGYGEREGYVPEEETEGSQPDTEGMDRVDDVEDMMHSLEGFDKRTVEDILRLAKNNFSQSPGKWEKLLTEVVGILNNRDQEDEDDFSGALQDKLTEANLLVVH